MASPISVRRFQAGDSAHWNAFVFACPDATFFHRIEWRDINTRVSWRYRNRLQFERPLAISEHKLTPYVACEPMYDTRHRTWSRTQCYVGSRIPLNKHVTFDGFYMRQWDARANPGFLHVFGAYWRLEY